MVKHRLKCSWERVWGAKPEIGDLCQWNALHRSSFNRTCFLRMRPQRDLSLLSNSSQPSSSTFSRSGATWPSSLELSSDSSRTLMKRIFQVIRHLAESLVKLYYPNHICLTLGKLCPSCCLPIFDLSLDVIALSLFAVPSNIPYPFPRQPGNRPSYSRIDEIQVDHVQGKCLAHYAISSARPPSTVIVKYLTPSLNSTLIFT